MFLNLLKAHSLVYNAIKTYNPKLQVGLVHQFIEMRPESNGPMYFNVLTAPIAARITQLFAKKVLLDWFTTGTFRWNCGFCLGEIDYQSPELPKLDFLGMNYYSRLVLAPQFKLVGMPGEPLSDTRCACCVSSACFSI
jgi:beta-glucosidase/6-phospho-beta-glucosidase/beta-galactosidase